MFLENTYYEMKIANTKKISSVVSPLVLASKQLYISNITIHSNNIYIN